MRPTPETLWLVASAAMAQACVAPVVFESDQDVPDASTLEDGVRDAGAHSRGPLIVTPLTGEEGFIPPPIVPMVTTVAGNGKYGWADGTGGPDGTAEFYQPQGVAVDSRGNVYVADTYNNRIRKIDAAGHVTTLAGNGIAGFQDGTGGPDGTAEFALPTDVMLDSAGNVYVTDSANCSIRMINAVGNVTTIAGNGHRGLVDGPREVAEFDIPLTTALDTHGTIYVADEVNGRIRMIDASGNVTTLMCGGMPLAFSNPYGVAVDDHGTVYVTEEGVNIIQKVDTAANVTTVAGNGSQGWVDGPGGPEGPAEFSWPSGIVVDARGNLYVADWGDNRIREIDASGNVTTLAGNGRLTSSDGTEGPNGTAGFCGPYGVALDLRGDVYVADYGNNRIRKIGR